MKHFPVITGRCHADNRTQHSSGTGKKKTETQTCWLTVTQTCIGGGKNRSEKHKPADWPSVDWRATCAWGRRRWCWAGRWAEGFLASWQGPLLAELPASCVTEPADTSNGEHHSGEYKDRHYSHWCLIPQPKPANTSNSEHHAGEHRQTLQSLMLDATTKACRHKQQWTSCR